MQPGSPLLTLIDPDTLWVTARVDETVVGRVATGQSARIRLRSGASLPGEVVRQGKAQVLTVVDGHARAQQVRIAASEGDRALVDKGLEAGASVITAPAAVAAGDRVEPQSPEGR